MKTKVSIDDLIRHGGTETTLASEAKAGVGSKRLTMSMALCPPSAGVWFTIYSGTARVGEELDIYRAIDVYNDEKLG